jgi:hypothetical protein
MPACEAIAPAGVRAQGKWQGSGRIPHLGWGLHYSWRLVEELVVLAGQEVVHAHQREAITRDAGATVPYGALFVLFCVRLRTHGCVAPPNLCHKFVGPVRP